MGRGRQANLKRRERAAKLYAAGLSSAEVGRRLGMTTESAYALLRRAGIEPARVLCRVCQALVSARSGKGNRSRGVLCLACLEKRPQATFAERLRALRAAAGLSQDELGERAGIPGGTIAAYEVGHCRPRSVPAARLVAVLGPQLFGGKAGK